MIRKAQPQDKEIYLELAREFYNSEAVLHPVPEEHLLRTYNEFVRSEVYTECFILEKDGETAGYALIAKTFSQEAGGLTVWIEELYIRPEFRSKGLGRSFFAFLLENRPAARYRLEVEPENERAVALYGSLGFTALPYGQMVADNGLKL